MYGLLGIEREDKAGRVEFIRENLRFFGAPHAVLLFIPPMGDRIRAAFDQGTYTENFLLSLEAHGYHCLLYPSPSPRLSRHPTGHDFLDCANCA